MKKLSFIILTYLLITINTIALCQDESNKINEENKILKIGVLVPLSGEYKEIGKSVLNAIKLALFDINDANIKIFPKDSKGDLNATYQSAKEFEEEGIKIVLGPIFHDNLSKLSTINNITFFSLTNKSFEIPKNCISIGINLDSQLNAINNFLKEKNLSKTILLIPKSEFEFDVRQTIKKNNYKFYKVYSYETDPKKITAEIEKITNYKQRKINLEARKKTLENSDLIQDKRELEKLENKYTLGSIGFDSVIVADFGERLKSVLSSFIFSDVTSKDVEFVALNQWFDESLFNETSTQNLLFPSINLKNFNKFRKKYFNIYNQVASEISILAYDNVGLIYFIWKKNNFDLKVNKIKSKSGFKGLQGNFFIKENQSFQNLKIYRISEASFKNVN